MEKSVIIVNGMSCEHCVQAITKAVSALPGTNNISVDLNAKTVTVDHNAILCSLDKIKLEIEDQGFDVI